jgi:hypothetical protein
MYIKGTLYMGLSYTYIEQLVDPGANPTILSYNANTTNTAWSVRKHFFHFAKTLKPMYRNASVVVVCKCSRYRIGSWTRRQNLVIPRCSWLVCWYFVLLCTSLCSYLELHKWGGGGTGRGCHMVYFQTKNENLGTFWRALEKQEMMVYFWPFGIFILVRFVSIWYIGPAVSRKIWQPWHWPART